MEEIKQRSSAKNKSPKSGFRGLVFLCILLALWSCQSKPVEVLQYFQDGSVSRRHFEVDGKKDGLMTDYYADGSIRGERMFVNDLQHGRAVWYYPDGSKKESQQFDKGIQTGTDSLWLPTGALQRVITFESGKKHGPMRTWSESGELILEVVFERDSLIEVKKSLTPQESTVPVQDSTPQMQ